MSMDEPHASQTGGKIPRRRRPVLPGGRIQDSIAEMIRVDHAGEYGACRIYQGQLAVLTRDPKAREAVRTIREMEAQERAHLEIFDDLVRKRQVRPTALTPFWHAAGYALGAGTALLGEKAAMACTAAVEEVIESHYAAQAERLGDADPALRGTIEKCRDEEITHRDEARLLGAEQAPFYPLLSSAIKFGCRVAIALSEKI